MTLASEYIKAGWALCPVGYKDKSPIGAGWNRKENALPEVLANMAPGLGLLHAYSGTAALDIDDVEVTRVLFQAIGIDLDALLNDPATVRITRGDPTRGKIIFRMATPLPSKKILHDGKTAYELRCATANGLSVQDVLPPSTHPSGQPYEWQGDFRQLSDIPEALLVHWNRLLAPDEPRAVPEFATPKDWDEINEALTFVSADCDREIWIQIGMALQATGAAMGDDEGAFGIWDAWSAQSKTKYDPKIMRGQWKSMHPRPNGIGLGTLFHYAAVHGWRRKIENVEHMFAPLGDDGDNSTRFSPKAPTVDMSLWPDILKRRALEVADEVGCDPIVPLMAGLCAVSAVANKQSRMSITDTFKVPPVIWAMTVGQPSDKKSPGSKPMFDVLHAIEKENVDKYLAEHLVWQGKEARHAAQMKAYREFCQSEIPMGNDAIPEVEALPPEPQQVRLLINDATSQKMVHMAQNRPRGFLMWLDEMNNWMRKLNDSKTTEDRGCWIAGFEATQYSMDRMSSGSIRVENLAVSIYGNVQPDVLRSHLKTATQDGLLQRFIPVILDGSKVKPGEMESKPEFMTCVREYENKLRMIYALPVQNYQLSREAKQIFHLFGEWHHKAMEINVMVKTPSMIQTANGKLTGTCARIAMLFHLVDHPFDMEVSAETMQRAVDVTKGFVYKSISYTYEEIGNIRNESKSRIVDYLIEQAEFKSQVSAGEIRKKIRETYSDDRPAWYTDSEMEDAMLSLSEMGYVVELTTGRNAIWAINPHLAGQTKIQRDRYKEARNMAEKLKY